MSRSPLYAARHRLSAIIDRFGNDADVRRPDGTATKNKYGKVSDTDVTYSSVGTERVRVAYPDDNDHPAQAGVDGGRVSTDSPILVCKHDTIIQEGDRVHFSHDGRTFSVEERREYDTHVTFTATLVAP